MGRIYWQRKKMSKNMPVLELLKRSMTEDVVGRNWLHPFLTVEFLTSFVITGNGVQDKESNEKVWTNDKNKKQMRSLGLEKRNWIACRDSNRVTKTIKLLFWANSRKGSDITRVFCVVAKMSMTYCCYLSFSRKIKNKKKLLDDSTILPASHVLWRICDKQCS